LDLPDRDLPAKEPDPTPPSKAEMEDRMDELSREVWAENGLGYCEDVTSFDWNWDNDMLCTRPDGSTFLTDYARARRYEATQVKVTPLSKCLKQAWSRGASGQKCWGLR
jgi:hypothetical protein